VALGDDAGYVGVVIDSADCGRVTLRLFLVFCLLWLLHAGKNSSDRQSRIPNMNSFTSDGGRREKVKHV
jgi:hypothetical protein